MPRSRLAVIALLLTAGVAVYGVATNPGATCAPAGAASDTPAEPVEDGSYRDGASYEC